MEIVLWFTAIGLSIGAATALWVILTIAYELFRMDNW